MTTLIEWTHFPDSIGETLNPIRAWHDDCVGWHCEKTSPGCRHCFAERQNLSGRFGGTKLRYTADSRAVVYLDQKVLEKPLHWRKPRTVLICSMSDLFGAWVREQWIDRVLAVAALTHWKHRFLILTKQATRMAEYFRGRPAQRIIDEANLLNEGHGGRLWNDGQTAAHVPSWPLPNVWLGVTVEHADYRDRIDQLREIPAAMRFVSCEPLLGEVDLSPWLRRVETCPGCGYQAQMPDTCPTCGDLPVVDVKAGFDWIIAGGESGPGARPMHPVWARLLRDQCQAASVPFFFKQWGGWVPSEAKPILGKHTGGGIFLRHDGSFGCQGDWWNGEAVAMDKVKNKKQAGRLLDGRKWNEFPEFNRRLGG
ncbi:MAG TPA: phage Gp37/Gp68 family protein [Phycisphaerae bacterium]|nr:phage Gp37/Gp68 family protein [Phycisphaerae bacterium]